MFTGEVRDWGLRNGREVLCISNEDWDFVIGKLYKVETCKIFKLVLKHRESTSTISTNSKFVLPNKLAKLLYIGD